MKMCGLFIFKGGGEKMDGIISTELPKSNGVLRQEILLRFGKQRLAALALGVSEGHLSNIVNGWATPGKDFIKKASLLFGKTPQELFPRA